LSEQEEEEEEEEEEEGLGEERFIIQSNRDERGRPGTRF